MLNGERERLSVILARSKGFGRLPEELELFQFRCDLGLIWLT